MTRRELDMKVHMEYKNGGCLRNSSGQSSSNWDKVNCEDCLNRRECKDISLLCFVSQVVVNGNQINEIKKELDFKTRSKFFKGVFMVLESVTSQVKMSQRAERANKIWDISKELNKSKVRARKCAGFHLQGAISSYDFSVAKQKLKDRNDGKIPDGSWVLPCDFPKRV